MSRFQDASMADSWPLMMLRLMRAKRDGSGTGSGPQKDRTGVSMSGRVAEVVEPGGGGLGRGGRLRRRRGRHGGRGGGGRVGRVGADVSRPAAVCLGRGLRRGQRGGGEGRAYGGGRGRAGGERGGGGQGGRGRGRRRGGPGASLCDAASLGETVGGSGGWSEDGGGGEVCVEAEEGRRGSIAVDGRG